jgi:NOL1/NOP2/sun family putative RNA methylase
MPATPIPVPEEFLQRMSRLLGDEYPAFAAAMAEEPRQGVRVNTLKLDAGSFRRIAPFPLGDLVPWSSSAFLLPPSDFIPGKHPFHTAGLYYLQDPSAMSAAELLDPQPGERVLDLAAAPGGKTTHLASLMKGTGLLVANEIKTSRLGSLVVNVERWGAGNTVVTNESPERLADHFGAIFDRVLLDAPCSGEGTFRRDPAARRDWSLQAVADYAAKQTSILRVAAHLVRPGGTLVYSTCTFAPEEDEGTIARFLKTNPDFKVVPLAVMGGFMPGRPEWVGEGDLSTAPTSGAVRLFPHRTPGEGHFVCRLQRKDGADENRSGMWVAEGLPSDLARWWWAFQAECLTIEFPEERLRLKGERLYLVPEGMPELRGLRTAGTGVWLGTFKKERFEPAHALALHLRKDQAKNVLDFPVDGGATPASSLIQRYLRGESLPSEGRPGWVLICAGGFTMGWGKRVQGIVKNHFPRGWVVVS